MRLKSLDLFDQYRALYLSRSAGSLPLWKSVKYWGHRLYQQHGTSAQYAGTHHKQGKDTLPKHLDAGNVIRVWHLCTRFFRATKDVID